MLQLDQDESSVGKFGDTSFIPELGDPAINRLLSLYPNAAPAKIPVRVGLPTRAKGAIEKTTIMFRVKDTVIFMVSSLVCGGEPVQLKPAAGYGQADGVVVASMPKGRGLAVAVRFQDGVPKWLARA